MKTTIRILVAAAAAFLVANAASAQNTDRAALIARGRYLVENVGLCSDCHSPRDQKGALVSGRELKGAPLAFAPTVPMPAWAGVAPACARAAPCRSRRCRPSVSARPTPPPWPPT
jgi:mono/diheme cytochrome c family protein